MQQNAIIVAGCNRSGGFIETDLLKKITVDLVEGGQASCHGVSFLLSVFSRSVGLAEVPAIREALSRRLTEEVVVRMCLSEAVASLRDSRLTRDISSSCSDVFSSHCAALVVCWPLLSSDRVVEQSFV